MKKIMMIGCGAMGGAILSGCLSKGLWTKEEVYIKASTEKSTVEKAERYGVSAASLKDIGEADFVLLAVKPDIIPFVLEEINPYRPRRVISVAAAVTAATLEAGLPEKTPVIRVMPNTPASVGEGMTAITAGRYADEDFIETAKEIFSAQSHSTSELLRTLLMSGCYHRRHEIPEGSSGDRTWQDSRRVYARRRDRSRSRLLRCRKVRLRMGLYDRRRTDRRVGIRELQCCRSQSRFQRAERTSGICQGQDAERIVAGGRVRLLAACRATSRTYDRL